MESPIKHEWVKLMNLAITMMMNLCLFTKLYLKVSWVQMTFVTESFFSHSEVCFTVKDKLSSMACPQWG